MSDRSALSDEEKFRFDLEGYLVVPGVLSASECSGLSELSDRIWPRQTDDGPFRRTANVSKWHHRFLELIDHPTVLPYLIALVGSRLRLDHDYCIYMQPGAKGTALHGGPRLVETDHWYYYSDGVMRNGLTVATWALTDAGPGDGGFVCVPGSHKTNYLRNLPKDVRSFERRPEYVRQPTLRAGDVLIFTEALIHGTAAWSASHERRTLLFKYSPPHSTWAKTPYDLAEYPAATPQQRRLLALPSVEDHPRVVDPDR